MRSFRVQLPPSEKADLDSHYPPSPGSSDIGKRAVAIMKYDFRVASPGCAFVEPPKGGDLAVLEPGTHQPRVFEVKGTSDTGIAWQKLKVSSKHSHALLVSGEASVLRVTEVFSDQPFVYEMHHGEDFILKPEDRWTFVAKHEANKRWSRRRRDHEPPRLKRHRLGIAEEVPAIVMAARSKGVSARHGGRLAEEVVCVKCLCRLAFFS